jgi:hypothetical protein
MEIDFPTYVHSPETNVVTLEETQAIPEKEHAPISPLLDDNNGNVVPIEELPVKKTNFQKYFATQHKEQTEEFNMSRAHLRKAKKAQKKALKSAKK